MKCLRRFGFELDPDERAEETFGLAPRWSAIPYVSCRVTNTRLKVTWHAAQAALAVFSLFYSLGVHSETNKYAIFLTNWTIILAAATYSLQLLKSCYTYFETGLLRSTANELTFFEKTLVVLLNTTSSLSIVVTALYWLIIYPSLSPESKSFYQFEKYLTHGAIAISVAIDILLFSTRPLRPQHLYQPVGAIAIYLAFSAVYALAGGRGLSRHALEPYKRFGGNPWIYRPLAWTVGPTSAVATAAGLLAATAMAHLALATLDGLVKWAFHALALAAACRKPSNKYPDGNGEDRYVGAPLQEV